MDVTTHQMDPRIARVHFLDYKKRVAIQREERRRVLAEEAKHHRSNLYYKRKQMDELGREDEELLAMYKAMSQGEKVIVLNEVFMETGVDDDFVPHLAIARADWRWVYFGCSHTQVSRRNLDRGPYFSSKSSRWDHTKENSLYVPRDVFPEQTTNEFRRNQLSDQRTKVGKSLCTLPVKAMVPTIPPYLRPDRPEKYWILWEADWDKTPPEDPILLRRLNMYTFSVVAEWDLTPLERTVLFGRPS